MRVNWCKKMRDQIANALDAASENESDQNHDGVVEHLDYLVDDLRKTEGDTFELNPLDAGLIWHHATVMTECFADDGPEERAGHDACVLAEHQIADLFNHTEEYYHHVDNLTDHDWQNQRDAYREHDEAKETADMYCEDMNYRESKR